MAFHRKKLFHEIMVVVLNEHCFEKPVQLKAKKNLVKSQEYAIIIMQLQKQFAPIVSLSPSLAFTVLGSFLTIHNR